MAWAANWYCFQPAEYASKCSDRPLESISYKWSRGESEPQTQGSIVQLYVAEDEGVGPEELCKTSSKGVDTVLGKGDAKLIETSTIGEG
jgi:hypothetical protein